MKKLLCTILAFLTVLNPVPLLAWSECGHHIIALMAFDMLSNEDQAKFLEILSKHPRYNDDFIPPKGLPNEKEIERWKIGHVGYWPDVARKQPKFNRSSWHYELGSTLVLGDEAKLSVPARPGPLPEAATLETQELYISQALELCTKSLKDSSTAPADRAIALCWVAHLVADAHQPCHAGSLYAEVVYTEKDGDRGGNRILTKQRGNLHSLWDQLFGDKYTLNGTNKRRSEIIGDPELISYGITASKSLDPQAWLQESRAIAIESVYTDEVLTSIEAVTKGLTSQPQKVDLTESYLKNAGRIAQRRAIEAAYRLANELQGIQ